MSPVLCASLTASGMAAIFAGPFVSWFHFGQGGATAVRLATLFSTLCAMVAFCLTYCVTVNRSGIAKPVFGAFRGSVVAIATFLVAVLAHTLVFPGNGGFRVSIFPVLLIGLATFGWLVAGIGAAVGLFCERHYFA